MSQSKSDDKPDGNSKKSERDPVFDSYLETLSGKLKHRVTQMKDARVAAGIKQQQPKPDDAKSFVKKMVN